MKLMLMFTLTLPVGLMFSWGPLSRCEVNQRDFLVCMSLMGGYELRVYNVCSVYYEFTVYTHPQIFIYIKYYPDNYFDYKLLQ